MNDKRKFDVIFSSDHLNKKNDIVSLFKNQEVGDCLQKEKILKGLNDFKLKLLCKELKQAKLKMTFGFNITSSIKFLMDILPNDIVISTSEFPPVIEMLQFSLKRPIAYLDLDDHNLNPIVVEKNICKKEIILLISHISYFDGKDLLKTMIDNERILKYLSDFKIHIIIDGAHAIGNTIALVDISKIKADLEKKLNICSFSYVFDCYKWLGGFWGMSILISTSSKLIQSHDFIFPNTKYETNKFGFNFFEPYSASFNPVLINWFLNTRVLKKHFLKLKKTTQKNKKLTVLFLRMFLEKPFKNMLIFNKDIPYFSNMVSIKVNNAHHLSEYLFQKGILCHIIAKRSFKIETYLKEYPEVLRFCFSSNLIKNQDIKYLIELLKQYDKLDF